MKVLERARGAERWGGCGAMGPGLWAAVLALGLVLEAAWAQPIFPSIANRPFIRECVRVHNEFRRRVVPAASNMRQMVGKGPGQARLAFVGEKGWWEAGAGREPDGQCLVARESLCLSDWTALRWGRVKQNRRC